jgi:hypothetical protein
MKRAWPVVVALLVVASANLFGQYGPILHAAADQERISVGDSIRLLGVASGTLRPEIGAEEARATLRKLGVRVPKAADESPITFGGYAYLLTQLFDVRGSAGYGIFPGPRSAFNELRSRGLVPAIARAGHPISGPDALLVLRRFLASRGGTR